MPEDFLAVAFASGGVTTGPMTVPFIMALGLGVSSIRSDENASQDSFGLVALCSIGPILAVLILAMIYPAAGTYTPVALPDAADVRQGIIASRIAAQAGEAALGRAWALEREQAMNRARFNLDWSAMREAAIDPEAVCERRKSFEQEEVCSMCGEFCAVKMARNQQWKADCPDNGNTGKDRE